MFPLVIAFQYKRLMQLRKIRTVSFFLILFTARFISEISIFLHFKLSDLLTVRMHSKSSSLIDLKLEYLNTNDLYGLRRMLSNLRKI